MKRAANSNGPPELVDRIYAVAIEPKRLEELADVWDARIRQIMQTDPEALALLQRPDLENHVERADDVLRRLGMDREPVRSPIESMLEEIPTAALVASPKGTIVAANRAATVSLPAVPGGTLSQLGFRQDDLEALLDRMAAAAKGASEVGELLRFRLSGSGRLVIIQLRGAPADVLAGNVLLVTTELTWPLKLGTLLRDAFELTAAETEVLQLLSQGLNAGEIGPATGRAEATIRSHIRALLAKTGARSQSELIRVTLGLMDVARTTEGIAPADLVRLPGQLPNEYHTIRLADGRRYDYLEIGDREGRPFLWLPKNYGLCRWTVDAEKALAERGLRMIATVRAGYGYSSPPPPRSDIYETAAHDALELMDQLGISSCPVATLGDDIRIGVTMACAAPRRVKSVIACGATMPANRPEHYARMPKWPRFIRGNARYAPMVLPFLLRAGFGMLRRAGGKAFMQTILGSSPADLSALEDEAVMTAMVIGSQITLSEHIMAHAAYSAEMIAFQRDWEPLLARCPAPITLFNGREDPHTPFETTREYLEKYPTIRLVDVPRQGHLAFLTHWRELIGLIENTA